MKKIFLGLISLMFLGSGLAYAGTYLDSAHGNTGYGVKRSATGFPTDYSKGNCAHCHEQHASIGGTQPDPKDATPAPSKFCLLADNFSGKATNLYAQSDNACFYCHYGLGTLQSTAFYNESYSSTFGGETPASSSIFAAFNKASYHNLKDVYNYITGAIGTKTWTDFPADSNPCSGCHNVHIAQRSCGKPTGSYEPANSAISRPSDHGNLWGDDDGTGVNPSERMDAYPDTYQAPYYYAATPTNYEPANNTTQDGSNLPNYATFCLDCHVNDVDGVGSLSAIDWGGMGDRHGQKAASSGGGHGQRIAPYDNTSGVYALSCTDCHEPHGSSNEWLLRTEVNAKSGISIASTGLWYEFCTACHSVVSTYDSHDNLTPSSSCTGISCHAHGAQF